MARKSKSEAPNSRIALLREERGWTQQELADKLYISARALSDIERGIVKNLSNYEMLSEIFGVPVDYLLEKTDFRRFPDAEDERLFTLFNSISTENKERIMKHIEIEMAYMK